MGRRNWRAMAPGGEPRTYKMYLPTTGSPRDFPAEGCRGRAEIRKAKRFHFLHRHMWDTVIILEEGNLPHPQRPRCDILVTWRALNRRHITTSLCAKGE